jgi:hypothetical protein
MYRFESPGNSRASVAQLNAELRHAELELLSAHCAAHQLRLHYSTDDLARFGRREVLRKSAEAADALSAFFSAIEKRIAAPAPTAGEFPQPTEAQVTQAVGWLGSYLRDQRQRYFPFAHPLGRHLRRVMGRYFPSALLDHVRVIELTSERVPVPDFLSQVRALGFDNLPDVTHMDSLTFLDVIAFNESLSERALFHALVHSLQMELLGLERYCELWVRGFLKTRAHFTVPLEVHAFSLASQFHRPETAHFSVETEVRRWIRDARY